MQSTNTVKKNEENKGKKEEDRKTMLPVGIYIYRIIRRRCTHIFTVLHESSHRLFLLLLRFSVCKIRYNKCSVEFWLYMWPCHQFSHPNPILNCILYLCIQRFSSHARCFKFTSQHKYINKTNDPCTHTNTHSHWTTVNVKLLCCWYIPELYVAHVLS